MKLPRTAGLSRKRRSRFSRHIGVERAAPIGFREIRLRFALDTDEPEDRRQSLLKLTERYCVVLQTLRTPPKLEASLSQKN